VPGAISYQTDYSYVLVPRKVGKFVISSASVKYKGKKYSSQPIRVKVVHQSKPGQSQPNQQNRQKRSSSRSQGSDDFFIEQVVDNQKPYLGQQTTMIFRFYLAKNLFEQPTLKWPDYKGFWVEDLPPQKTYNKVVKGRTYRVTEIRKALFPTVTGKITIEPVVMNIPPNAFGFFDSDPFNFFSRRRNRQSYSEKVLRTRKIVLNVQPLPTKGKPADFSGAVGTFNFQLTTDNDTVEVDQPVTLKAVLSGNGNIKKLPGIDIPPLENFRLYDSGSNDNISKQNYRVSGSKTFEWVLIPTAPGVYELPKLTFNYFDPWSRKYRSITRNINNVIVSPSSVASLLPGERSANIIPAARTSLNYIVTELSDEVPGKPLFSYKLIWVVQALPIIWLAFLAVYISRNKRLEGDVAYARRKFASKAAKYALQNAQAGFHNPEQFYGLIFHGIVGFISDKSNISVSGMTNSQIIEMLKKTGRCEGILDEFSEFIDQCDAGRFSPVKPSEPQMLETYERALNLLSDLDRRFN